MQPSLFISSPALLFTAFFLSTATSNTPSIQCLTSINSYHPNFHTDLAHHAEYLEFDKKLESWINIRDHPYGVYWSNNESLRTDELWVERKERRSSEAKQRVRSSVKLAKKVLQLRTHFA